MRSCTSIKSHFRRKESQQTLHSGTNRSRGFCSFCANIRYGTRKNWQSCSVWRNAERLTASRWTKHVPPSLNLTVGLARMIQCTKTLKQPCAQQPRTMPGYQTSTAWTRFDSTAASSAHRDKRRVALSIVSA